METPDTYGIESPDTYRVRSKDAGKNIVRYRGVANPWFIGPWQWFSIKFQVSQTTAQSILKYKLQKYKSKHISFM